MWNGRRDRHLLVFGSAEGWFRGRLWHRFYDRLAGVSRITVEGTGARTFLFDIIVLNWPA